VKALAREMTQEALDALKAVVTSPNAPPAARVSAANAILDRGWGRPKETIENTGKVTIEDLVLASYRHEERVAEAQKQAEEDKLH
jgi:hypothetical protein